MNKRLIVACIPAYNEEKSIAKVVLKSRKYVDKVIVCDDGSTDMTGEIAEALGAEVIRHHKNMGYGAALESLFRRALDIRADIVVTLDADGQHNPEDIPRIIEPILRGEADIVIGSRFLSSRSKMPAYRRIGVKIINSIFRAGAKKISDTQSGYRAYSIKALSLVRPIESGMGASVEILLKAEQNKLRIKEIPIRIYYKVEQPSKVNPVVHALDVILTTLKHKSIRHPLMFYGGPGAVSIVTALTTGLLLVQIFNESRYFSLPLAILTVGFSLIGIVLCSTAIILWILVSLIREMKE